MKIYKVIY